MLGICVTKLTNFYNIQLINWTVKCIYLKNIYFRCDFHIVKCQKNAVLTTLQCQNHRISVESLSLSFTINSKVCILAHTSAQTCSMDQSCSCLTNITFCISMKRKNYQSFSGCVKQENKSIKIKRAKTQSKRVNNVSSKIYAT